MRDFDDIKMHGTTIKKIKKLFHALGSFCRPNASGSLFPTVK
jgi:hypothetical protein